MADVTELSDSSLWCRTERLERRRDHHGVHYLAPGDWLDVRRPPRPRPTSPLRAPRGSTLSP